MFRPQPGAARYLRVTSTSMSDGVPGTDVLTIDLVGGRFAETNTAGAQSSGSGYDGTHAWTTDSSGTPFVQGNRDTRADVVFRALVYGSGARSVVQAATIRDPDSGLGKRVTFAGLARGADIFADDDDTPPWQIIMYEGSDSTVLSFSQYRTIAGVMMPTRMQNDIDAGQDFHVVRAEPLSSVDPAVFAPPRLPNDTTLDGIDTIPIEYRDDCPVVEVQINGVRLHMLVDSGGSNGLTPSAARRAGLVPVGHARAYGFGKGSLPTQFAMVESTRVGRAEMRHQEFDVLDDSKDMFHTDGTLGSSFFARFGIEIDPLHETMRLARDAALLNPAGDRLPIVFNDGQPQLDGTLEDISGPFTFDSGSAFVDIMRPTVTRYDLCKRMHSTAMVEGGGIGGTNSGCVAHAKTMTLGTHRETNVLLSLAVTPDAGFDDDTTIGNVGSPILDSNVVTYDYLRSVIWMRHL